MNACFLIVKIIEKIEYKFIIQSKNKAIVKFKAKLLNGNIVKIKAYDEIADKIYRKHNIDDYILINGYLDGNCIQIIAFDKI